MAHAMSALHPIDGSVSPAMTPAPSLLKTIEKLAAAGELAGFSPQDLIDMLNGGLSVADLLDVIAYCLRGKPKPHD